MSFNTQTTNLDQLRLAWMLKAIIQYQKALRATKVFTDMTPMLTGSKTAYIPLIRNTTVAGSVPETDELDRYAATAIVDGVNAITLNQFKYASFALSVPLQELAYLDYAALYAPKLGYALALELDAVLFQQVASITAQTQQTGMDCSPTSNMTDPQLLEYLRNVKSLLDQPPANAPEVPDDERCWVFDPYTYNRVATALQFAQTLWSKDMAVESGVIGNVLGAPAVKSTNLYKETLSGSDYRHCIYTHKSALGFVSRLNLPMFEGETARFPATQITQRLSYGYATMPNDGTNNYQCVDILVKVS